MGYFSFFWGKGGCEGWWRGGITGKTGRDGLCTDWLINDNTYQLLFVCNVCSRLSACGLHPVYRSFCLPMFPTLQEGESNLSKAHPIIGIVVTILVIVNVSSVNLPIHLAKSLRLAECAA